MDFVHATLLLSFIFLKHCLVASSGVTLGRTLNSFDPRSDRNDSSPRTTNTSCRRRLHRPRRRHRHRRGPHRSQGPQISRLHYNSLFERQLNDTQVVGIILAVASGFLIGTSFVFKKKGLLRSQAGGVAGEGVGYLKSVRHNCAIVPQRTNAPPAGDVVVGDDQYVDNSRNTQDQAHNP